MAEDRHLLTDIRLRLRHHELRPVYEVDTALNRVPARRDSTSGSRRLRDFAIVGGRDNLAQAVIMRLLTPRGELGPLGHPEYGSRLHELIGRENTPTVRNLAKLFILESLEREPRIAKITALTVEPHDVQRDRIDVTLAVRPAAASGSVTIGPFTLRLAP